MTTGRGRIAVLSVIAVCTVSCIPSHGFHDTARVGIHFVCLARHDLLIRAKG
ncbi:MAG: hypothetical protein IKD00_04385 [Candidatus Methanomethylophilaceae archaeon]|nr:hypothetical protein [Candidatus Methanomethylophilaceae archaeon]